MNTHDLKNIDQAEANTLRQRLQLHAANLRGMAHAAGHQVSQPNLSGDPLADIRVLEAHCTELELRLDGTAPVFAAPAPAVHTPAASVTGKKLTLTQQILAAKGCATLEDLNAQHEAAIMAGSDDENKREVEDQRKNDSGRPHDSDSNEHDRQKQEDAKKSPHEIGVEMLGLTRSLAYTVSPGCKPTMTSKVLAAKGVKSLGELNAKYARMRNSGANAGD